MCSMTLIGILTEKQSDALNSLGISGLIILTYDPSLSQGLAFQLSFAATFSILLLHPPVEKWLDGILQSRRLSEVINMNPLDQHAYCLLMYLKQALALTIAVNIVAIPITIHYFREFPVMSLVYNLFFPLLVTVSVCLFIIATILSVIPLIGTTLHSINSYYTGFILRLTSQIPQEVDYNFYMESYSSFILTGYLCCIMLLAIFWKEKTLNDDAGYSFI